MIERPDPEKVLARLKDFQRKTVEHTWRRLYSDPDAVRRFLVADEAGLGKTLVARGVIAKAVDALWEDTERIDIVYICSNSAIARQNIARLNITEGHQAAIASRITLLPLQLKDLTKQKLNFISFTPNTSFNLRGSLGMWRERALLHRMLSEPWGLRGTGPLNVLQGTATAELFREGVKEIARAEIDTKVAEAFGGAALNNPELRSAFEDLCERFSHAGARNNRPDEDLILQNRVVGQLRALLARTCLDALEPDLVILDEFQRFKHLLATPDDGTTERKESEESELAHQLFNYSDDKTTARVLLLSATPYKMYTGAGEDGEEDHYKDFVATIRFLQDDAARTAKTEHLLQEFRRNLLRLEGGGLARLKELKEALESELRRVMVRTERLAVTPDRDGMLTQMKIPPLPVTASEVRSFAALDRVALAVDHHNPVEYWKSSPYLMSFMEEYALKQNLEELLEGKAHPVEVAALVDRELRLTLPWEDVSTYQKLDPGNARMAWLYKEIHDRGAWRLLWIPPAQPWYRLEGAYGDPVLRGFTKHLIFSSWQVVPKAIAAMMSYEAERRAMELDVGDKVYSREDQKAVPLLRFAEDGGAPLMALIYPSFVLAELGGKVRQELWQQQPTLEEALRAVEAQLEPLLARLPAPVGGREDDSWYWAAPALLDLLADKEVVHEWLNGADPAEWWLGEEKADEERREGIFERVHFKALAEMIATAGRQLGARPGDLLRHLALLTIAGPANVALRALSQTVTLPEPFKHDWLRGYAGQIAWALRSYFNLPEIIALVRQRDQGVPYWKKVLEHCAAGGLGALLEEYAHVLTEWLGVKEAREDVPAEKVTDEMREAIGIRTANVGLDVAELKNGRVGLEQRRMRSRFAVRLTEEKEDGSEGRQRLDQVRSAFNSPFWPFILATTSVGQEGLDFHLYSHAVVHWNLPSNPVDLEQREGRVHRFKGHAVRKNVALRQGKLVAPNGGDHWHAMFEASKVDRPEGSGDLWPYWICPTPGGSTIERHVPVLPLSRDADRYVRLRRSLTLYRMVFGQPRQDDLMEYLVRHFTPEEAERQAEMLRLDLGPPA